MFELNNTIPDEIWLKIEEDGPWEQIFLLDYSLEVQRVIENYDLTSIAKHQTNMAWTRSQSSTQYQEDKYPVHSPKPNDSAFQDSQDP